MTGAAENPGRWPVWLLALLLYPFAAGAAYVNLFFLFLMLQVMGLSALSTWQSVLGGLLLGLPCAWVAARWLRGLIDHAEAAADREA